MDFPGGSVVKNPPANAGDAGLIPGLGGFPGEGNGNPLQYSWLGNPTDRGEDVQSKDINRGAFTGSRYTTDTYTD